MTFCQAAGIAGTMGLFADAQGWLQRIFAPRPQLSAYTGGLAPVYPDFNQTHAMSAIARFPWVMTCVRAKAGDLAGLPLVVVRTEGGRSTIVQDHPTLRLLRRPAPRCSGLRLRRQLYADFELTGNAWQIMPTEGLLYRAHPGEVQALRGPFGDVDAVRFAGIGYNASEFLHVADISWTPTAAEVFGESKIRALHNELLAISASTKLVTMAAQRGRIDFLLTPKDENSAGISDEAARRVVQAYEDNQRAGHGVWVLTDPFNVEKISLSPEDLQYQQLRAETRDAVLAVFEVPPARAGLATANYGTQKQQMRTYYEALLNGVGALFDDEWSLLAERDGQMGDQIQHDATRIEPLQASQTERQLRAERWMLSFGATPRDAAAYEGFPDAPTGAPGTRARPAAAEVDEPQQRALAAHLHQYLQQAASRYDARILAADGVAENVAALGEESILALQALEHAGVDHSAALLWAAELADAAEATARHVAAEGAAEGTVRTGLAALSGFSQQRAHWLASQIAEDAA